MDILIYQVIGLTKLQYINFVDKQFNAWCEDMSYTFYLPMRELQTNSSLYNWFSKRWDSSVVEPFLEVTQDYIMKGIKDPDVYLNIFSDHVQNPAVKIIGTYPSVLLKNIQKQHYKSISKNDR